MLSTVVQTVPSEPQLLELNHLVLGEDHSHVFPVTILASKTVGALKKAIKNKKKPAFDHIPADALILWSVSIPAEETLGEILSKLELVDE
jgi:Crinkler effector protein N-terminal domain